ncbi:Aspartate aminotransferase [hydrothermal vent metagenome]|uniref:Aspartate aminotransferase n=1 Tax=hydrothermal vent metagenome TaxID=652676 RepID=A0A3B1DIH3_9ZZZZ
MNDKWISDRLNNIHASGIRKVFDLAAKMEMPINMSIGQPHYDTPDVVKEAIKRAIDEGHNGYSPSQGIAPLIETIQESIDHQYHHDDRKVFITSGTSGALMLALCTLVDPGDEVIFFDPYFVMYKHLVSLAGGKSVMINTYPDFRIDVNRVKDAITPKTKAIICNSPANPTGYVPSKEEIQGLAELAAEKDIALISDEIYKQFSYDHPFVSPAQWNKETIVIDGFSKSHSMTGMRLGYAHGPNAIMQQMIKLQQFTFVCAPQPVQWGGIAAWDCDISHHANDYHRKRDYLKEELKNDYEIAGANGAFYMFLKTPWGTGTEFISEAIQHNLLIIPGNVFSEQDTHFRISFAAEDSTLQQGAEILKKLARK